MTPTTEEGFDARKPFIIEIESGGIRRCELRMLSDAEWIARQKKIVVMQEQLSGERTRLKSIPYHEIDFPFFKKALIDKPGNGEDFDEYEASLALAVLARFEIIDAEKNGAEIVINAKVFGNRTVSLAFALPRRRHFMIYRENSVDVIQGKSSTEIHSFLGPCATFFDSLLTNSNGYALGSPIPILHKDVVVTKIIAMEDPFSPQKSAPAAGA